MRVPTAEEFRWFPFVMYPVTTLPGTACRAGPALPRRIARRDDPAHPVDDPSAFGVAELDEGRVVRAGQTHYPPSDMALVGVYPSSPAIFEAARHAFPVGSWRAEITEAIQTLIDDGHDVRLKWSWLKGRTPVSWPTC